MKNLDACLRDAPARHRARRTGPRSRGSHVPCDSFTRSGQLQLEEGGPRCRTVAVCTDLTPWLEIGMKRCRTGAGTSPACVSTLPASSWLAVTQMVQTLPWGAPGSCSKACSASAPCAPMSSAARSRPGNSLVFVISRSRAEARSYRSGEKNSRNSSAYPSRRSGSRTATVRGPGHAPATGPLLRRDSANPRERSTGGIRYRPGR
jgi:hypothetical protein